MQGTEDDDDDDDDDENDDDSDDGEFDAGEEDDGWDDTVTDATASGSASEDDYAWRTAKEEKLLSSIQDHVRKLTALVSPQSVARQSPSRR